MFTYSYLNLSINLINGKKNWSKNIFNDRWRQSWISGLLCFVVVIRSSCCSLVSPEYTSIFSRYPLEASRWRRGGFWGDHMDVNENRGGQLSPTKCREETVKNWLPMKVWGGGVVRISQSLRGEITLSWHNQNNQNNRKKLTVSRKMMKILPLISRKRHHLTEIRPVPIGILKCWKVANLNSY